MFSRKLWGCLVVGLSVLITSFAQAGEEGVPGAESGSDGGSGSNFFSSLEHSSEVSNSAKRFRLIKTLERWNTNEKFLLTDFNKRKVELPTQEMLEFMVSWALENLDRYINADPLTCSDLWDYHQFEITYRSLDNITGKFVEIDPKIRRYFLSLQFQLKSLTGMDPDQYVIYEGKRARKFNKKNRCGLVW
ncbi:hypothetical protein HOF92_09815 [bacterium]|jgi:hypothetical protein|nr:hypothetical protein [bacterium]